jgi:hypothetical protein
MAGPRHPENRWFLSSAAAVTLVALALMVLVYRTTTRARSFAALDEAAQQELAAVSVIPQSTNDVEKRWVAKGFESGYLMAPAGPIPCAEAVEALAPADRAAAHAAFEAMSSEDAEDRIGAIAPIAEANPHNLIAALLMGTELVRAERHQEADVILSRALDRSRIDEDIIAASRQANTKLSLDDTQVSTVIHLHHVLGIARLHTGQQPWKALKNVIGSVKALSRKRLLGVALGQATAARLVIPAPGCTDGTLTTYDLYNNLVTGYARAASYPADPRARQREFGRHAAGDGRPLNVLLQAMWRREIENGWKNEAKLWALSNAKELLDWQVPDEARLDFNLAQLLDWWVDPARCPTSVCTPQLLGEIREQRDALLVEAIHKRDLSEAERAEFARGITRMLAGSTIDRAALSAELAEIAAWLPAEKAATLTDLQNASAARSQLPGWIIAPESVQGTPFDKLGHKASDWRKGAVHDFAEAAAVWAAPRSDAQKKQVIVATHQLLGAASAPPALVTLENSLSLWQRIVIRLSASKLWWMFVALLVAFGFWFFVMFWLVQLRERRLLRRSFYNIELDYLRATGDHGQDER